MSHLRRGWFWDGRSSQNGRWSLQMPSFVRENLVPTREAVNASPMAQAEKLLKLYGKTFELNQTLFSRFTVAGLRAESSEVALAVAGYRPVEVATHSLGKPPSCARSCLGSLFCPVPRWCVRRKRAEKVAGDCRYLSNGSKERSFVGFRWLVKAADLSHEL